MTSWKLPVAAIGALAIVINLILVAAGREPDLGLVAALCVLIGVAIWTVYDMLDRAASTVGVPMGQPVAPPPRADRRVARLRSGLAFGRADDVTFENLRRTLIDLIADQLRAEHDVDLAAGTEVLRPLIGDRLVRLLDDPESARLLADPAQLDRLLSDIERL